VVRGERTWIVIGLIIAGAVVLLLTAALMAPERSSDIWVNLAGSAAQIVVLAISGGVVATVVRDRESRRDDDRRRQERLLAFANEVDLGFNEIKRARRLLRTFGFDAPAGRILTAEQATGLRAQMAQLNDTELSFEMHARTVEARPTVFGPQSEALRGELDAVSAYLRRVLLEWETDPTVVAEDADASVLLGWQHFSGFVAYDDASLRAFRDGVADPVARIDAILAQRGAPPVDTHRRPVT
jgi:hypothetical protein